MENKFSHMADIHLDSPFDYLNDPYKEEIRRNDQRIGFKNAILDAYHKDSKFLLISGDLFDGEIADISTIRYIDEVFSLCENMKIVIIAGNHDLYNNNNLIYKYKFNSKNVIVLNKENNNVLIDDYKIYSYIDEDEKLDSSLYNILMWHGEFNESGKENPLPNYLKTKGFDYIALGHIHQFEDHSNQISKIYYPGCLMGRGFDELNEKGYLLVNGIKNNTTIKQINLDNRKYIKIEIDVSSIDYESIFTLRKEIANKITNPCDLYEITLIGNRKTKSKINKSFLLKEIENLAFFIKVKDITNYKIEESLSLIEQIFIKKIDESILNETDENKKNNLIKAKEIGLKALRNEVIYDEDM